MRVLPGVPIPDASVHSGSARGLSLVELLAAAAIAAVLAAITVPAYRGYVLRANRAVGKTVLLEIAGRQESYFNERKVFADSLSTWYPVDAQGRAWFLRDGGADAGATRIAIYRVRLTRADTWHFRLEAEPINAQASDIACGALSYDSLGSHGASGTLGAGCWR